VAVAPSYRVKFGWLGAVLDALAVRARYRQGIVNLLRRLKEHVERSAFERMP
jgi:hypothetical protein